jgi:hypothetical protein
MDALHLMLKVGKALPERLDGHVWVYGFGSQTCKQEFASILFLQPEHYHKKSAAAALFSIFF